MARHPHIDPYDPFALARIENAANQSAPGLNRLAPPTEAQAKAGNYPKGKFTLHGLDISIENPRDSVREGMSGGRTGTRSGMGRGAPKLG